MTMQLEEQIVKLLNDELGDTEKESLYQLFEEDEEAKELYITKKNLWVKTGFSTSAMMQENELKDDYRLLRKKIKVIPRSKVMILNLARYAALALLMISIGTIVGYHLHRNYITSLSTSESNYVFHSGNSSITSVDLPDGSKITLNANTTITVKDNAIERHVILDGEALFEVIHNENKPFVVETGGLRVVDVGTIFNIKSYEVDDFVETTLLEGVVDLFIDDTHKSTLKPGETAEFNKLNRYINVKPVEHHNIIAWKENRFIYKDESLDNIISDIVSWYGITSVEWHNDMMQEELLSINIQRKKSIDQVLDVMSLTGDFKYKLTKNDGNDVLIIY